MPSANVMKAKAKSLAKRKRKLEAAAGQDSGDAKDISSLPIATHRIVQIPMAPIKVPGHDDELIYHRPVLTPISDTKGVMFSLRRIASRG